jgi:hypothetical protein
MRAFKGVGRLLETPASVHSERPPALAHVTGLRKTDSCAAAIRPDQQPALGLAPFREPLDHVAPAPIRREYWVEDMFHGAGVDHQSKPL